MYVIITCNTVGIRSRFLLIGVRPFALVEPQRERERKRIKTECSSFQSRSSFFPRRVRVPRPRGGKKVDLHLMTGYFPTFPLWKKRTATAKRSKPKSIRKAVKRQEEWNLELEKPGFETREGSGNRNRNLQTSGRTRIATRIRPGKNLWREESAEGRRRRDRH